MIKVIIEYIRIIKDFESELKNKFKLKRNPWNYIGGKIPKNGFISKYQYRSHGAGFKIQKNNLVCEYDIAPINDNDIKFSFWKISEFIKTHNDFNTDYFSEKRIEEELIDMIDKNILSKLKIGDFELNLYQINKDWEDRILELINN